MSKGPNYITPAGYRVLRAEQQRLRLGERPKIVEEVAYAASLGDRSENAEYIYGKRQLAEIDRRIRYLSKRLDELTIVDRTPDDPTRVYFGAWVTLEDEDGGTKRHRLVGPDEFDREKDFISVDAPLSRLLIGKSVDDEVALELGEDTHFMTIVGIEYETRP